MRLLQKFVQLPRHMKFGAKDAVQFHQPIASNFIITRNLELCSIFALYTLYQGWPDFLVRGPNLKDIFGRGPQFFLFRNFFELFFTILSFLMIIEGKYNLQYKSLVMTKRLAGHKNNLKGRMRPAGRTLATPAIYQNDFILDLSQGEIFLLQLKNSSKIAISKIERT